MVNKNTWSFAAIPGRYCILYLVDYGSRDQEIGPRLKNTVTSVHRPILL